MAKVYKRSNSPFYWMQFMVNGERIQESTKEKDKVKAQRAMKRRLDQLKGMGGVQDIFDKLMKALEKEPDEKKRTKLRKELSIAILADEVDTVKLSDAFRLYKDADRESSPADSTWDSYERIWNKFVEWIGENHSEISDLRQVDPLTASEYMKYLWKAKCSPRTFNWKLTLLKSVFAGLTLEANLDSNPFAHIVNKAKRTESRQPLTSEQIGKVLELAEGEMHTLTVIGRNTGMRLGDAVRLKWSDIDFKGGTITITPGKTARLDKQVTLPIMPELLAELMTLKRNREYVVPDLRKEFERDHTILSNKFRLLLEGIDLTVNAPRKDGRGTACLYSFHSLRHGFVTECAKAGVSKDVAMEMVGHGSEAVSRIYTHIDTETKKREMRKVITARKAESA